MPDRQKAEPADLGRRAIIRTALYVAPVIVTLSVTPQFAGSASGPGIDEYPPTAPDSYNGNSSRRGLR